MSFYGEYSSISICVCRDFFEMFFSRSCQWVCTFLQAFVLKAVWFLNYFKFVNNWITFNINDRYQFNKLNNKFQIYS